MSGRVGGQGGECGLAWAPLRELEMAKSAQLKSIHWWHENMSDFMISNPKAGNRELAAHFGMSEPWTSTITRSDVFQAYHALRLEKHRKMVSESVIEKTEGLARLSLDVLEERIERERASLNYGAVKETAEMALKALGYGGRAAPGPAVQVNLNLVDRDTLASAREKMRAVTIDHKDKEALPAPA